jgi:hypothetical protein
MQTIEIEYTPRPLQRELHKMLDENRFNVLVMHRRFGKTVCAINHLIKRAIEDKNPNWWPGTTYAALPPAYPARNTTKQN